MILTVTLNAALDVTYEVDELRPDASHRVRAVHERAGGKGINVARVLHGQGHEVTCAGLVGGATGQRIAAELEAAGLVAALTPIAAESRRTVSVVSRATGGSTLFNEPGPSVSDAEWQALRVLVDERLLGAQVLVLSGSVPPGVPLDAYAVLTRAAHAAGVRVIVDADGEALRRALAAGPDVVTPNEWELLDVTGETDVPTAMRALTRAGAGVVVATLGADGMRAATPEGELVARLSAPIEARNPTGAGDAVVAAIAAGMAEGQDWHAMLREAVAWSAAAAVAPLAGDLDADLLARIHPLVHVAAV